MLKKSAGVVVVSLSRAGKNKTWNGET